MDGPMDEIFISYSRQNNNFVDKLVAELEKLGLSVWVDREDIRGGTAWRAAISSAIRACDIFIIVLSEQSALSNNVTKELALADKHKKTIIPICYQSCEIPPNMEYQLAGLQIIDFAEQPFTSGLEQLINALPLSVTSNIQRKNMQPVEIRKTVHPSIRSKNLKLLAIICVVGLILLGIILIRKLSLSNFQSEQDLSGLYSIDGIDFDCLEYGGEATLTKSGSSYVIGGTTWWEDAVPRSQGSGVGNLNGKVFTIVWDMNAGETSYSLQPDGSFTVKWVHGATSCDPGETWTPQ